MATPTTTTYTARSGAKQYKPSIELVGTMSENNEGFCLACGEVNHGVEPDVRKGECEYCHASKVYGPDELALMGLVF